MKKYLKVWYLMTAAAVMGDLTKRFSALLLLTAKAVRIVLFVSFLLILLSGKTRLAGYSFNEILIFFLTFNLIDSLTQLLLRGAYHFRDLVIKGNFDYLLIRPLNPLFSVLFSHTDILDFLILWPILFFLIRSLSISEVTALNLLFYFLLVVNGLFLAIGFHILVISFAITTYEVDNALMIYRDLSSLARVPVDLYREPIRFLITFVLPIGLMATVPVKAVLGLLSAPVAFISFLVSLAFLYVSLRIWSRSLRLYSSASS